MSRPVVIKLPPFITYTYYSERYPKVNTQLSLSGRKVVWLIECAGEMTEGSGCTDHLGRVELHRSDVRHLPTTRVPQHRSDLHQGSTE